MELPEHSKDDVVNLSLDTINKGKQALVFVSSKKSAEKVAEDISKKIKEVSCESLADSVLKVLSSPTRQCVRLASCVKRSVAFHHAGLAPKQKELIEDSFREGKVKIICCTPTLAAGLSLPAFRSIIRDVKRYSGVRGMTYIPVLEFLQMAGRCGRPEYDSHGEAIVITSTESEKNAVYDHYICGAPEPIYSKLSVEPVLRTYVLSLISIKVIQTKFELLDFFGRTFFAHQYNEFDELEEKLIGVVDLLEEWSFLTVKDDHYNATALGKRVAELYVDPLTAWELLNGLKKASVLKPVGLLQLICSCLEMRPLLSVKQKDFEIIQNEVAKFSNVFLSREPSMFDPEYEDWLASVKTMKMLNDWIEEKSEDFLLDEYGVRPGELHVKRETADWLLYACYELSRLSKWQHISGEVSKVRFRLKYGAKEELLPLLRLQQIGRVRARRLFNAGLTSVEKLRSAPLDLLSRLLGHQTASFVRKQLEE